MCYKALKYMQAMIGLEDSMLQGSQIYASATIGLEDNVLQCP
jgi:hypothetical protein